MFAAILALLQALPILKAWFDDFFAWYAQTQLASMKAANIAAIRTAVQAQDQRDLEKAIGSAEAGEKTNDPTSEIRDSLPGVSPVPAHTP